MREFRQPAPARAQNDISGPTVRPKRMFVMMTEGSIRECMSKQFARTPRRSVEARVTGTR